MSSSSEVKPAPARLLCVDQLRGYAIFGMLLVNAKSLFFKPVAGWFEGSDAQAWFQSFLYQVSHHRTEFTYADTIAPLFVFVVGMGMRLSWLRRSQRVGATEARKAMFNRYCLLVLIACVIYAGWYWDALMDIGLAGLLALWFIDKKPSTRMLAAFGFLLLYQAVHMFTSYGVWSMEGSFSRQDPEYIPFLVKLIPLSEEWFSVSLNGGPLGPLSWVMMLFFGAHAYDLMAAGNEKRFVIACLAWGFGLCALAFALHLEWPGVKEAWPFSARYMTAPFPLWSTGLCFLQLLAFYCLCDKVGFAIPTFTAVGMNPLALYIFQSLFLNVTEKFNIPDLSPLAGFGGFALFWGALSAAAWYLHKKRIYFKL